MIIDLFCGCGGLSLGAHMAGLGQEIGVDFDGDLTSSYQSNFPLAQLLNADLSKLSPRDLERMFDLGRPNAILGGPPCQGFSVMGRRNRKDPRNKLLRVFFDYVAYFRPGFFLMENVPGLFSDENRSQLDRALSRLPSRYRVLKPTIFDTADFGVATVRPRLIVIGYDAEYVDRFEIKDLEAKKPRFSNDVSAAIADLPRLNRPAQNGEWLSYSRQKEISRYAKTLRKAASRDLGSRIAKKMHRLGKVSGCQLTQHKSAVTKRFSSLSPGARDPISKYPKLSWDKPANVLRAGTGADRGSYQAARPIHPDEPRVITVREAARIQGFPDWFQFHPTKWHSHRMIGNSVSPLFAEKLLKVVAAKLDTSRV